jgi:hypothetical protein
MRSLSLKNSLLSSVSFTTMLYRAEERVVLLPLSRSAASSSLSGIDWRRRRGLCGSACSDKTSSSCAQIRACFLAWFVSMQATMFRAGLALLMPTDAQWGETNIVFSRREWPPSAYQRYTMCLKSNTGSDGACVMDGLPLQCWYNDTTSAEAHSLGEVLSRPTLCRETTFFPERR